MPIFRVKSIKIYAKKNLHGYIRGIRDKYQVCSLPDSVPQTNTTLYKLSLSSKQVKITIPIVFALLLPPTPTRCSTAGSRDLTLRPLLSFQPRQNQTKRKFKSGSKRLSHKRSKI